MSKEYALLKYTTYVVTLIVIIYAGYWVLLWVTWDYDWNFRQADSCLNNGGVWQKDISHCWHAGQCEDKGGHWYGAEHRCVFDKS